MRKEGKEGSGWEEVSVLQVPQLPTVKPVIQLEMAHSVYMLEGLTSIKKGSMSESLEQRQGSEIMGWIWVYSSLTIRLLLWSKSSFKTQILTQTI